MSATLTSTTNWCPKCGNSGWVWWFQLDEYDGPAMRGQPDDTRYTCDMPYHAYIWYTGINEVPRDDRNITDPRTG